MSSYRFATTPVAHFFPRLGQVGKSFPVRVRPYSCESGTSYLLRLAYANGYDSMSPILRRLQTLASTPAKIRALLHLSREEWGKLYLPWPKRGRPADAKTPSNQGLALNYATTRWCPLCMREAIFLNARWSIRLYCTCPYHRCLLMDACHSCGTEPSATQVLSGHCASCGHSLFEKVFDATDEIKVVQSHFQQTYEQEPLQTLAMTPTGWARLIQFMAVIEFRQANLRTGQLSQLHRMHVLAPVCHRLGCLLADWPTNFRAWLDNVKAMAPSSFSLKRTFGRIYHWLYVELEGPEFFFLREAFEEYLHRSWEGLITRRNRRQEKSRHEPGCISVDAASHKLSITPTELKRLHHAGWLTAHVVTSPSGRTFWSIPDKQLADVRWMLDEGLTLEAAAKYLGLSRPRTRALARSRWLPPQLTPGDFASPVWRFPLYTLNTLLTRCQTRSGHATTSSRPIALNVALKTMRIDDQCFVDLIDAIVMKQVLRFNGEERLESLGDMLLNKGSLQAWLASYRIARSERLTVPEAAARLGIKQQVAYHLVRNGKLASIQEGKVQRWVLPKAIAAFEQDFISLSSLAREYGTSPKALLAHIAIKPIIGPNVDGCRQYFYRREDITDFAMGCRA